MKKEHLRGTAWWRLCGICWLRSPALSWSGWHEREHGDELPYPGLFDRTNKNSTSLYEVETIQDYSNAILSVWCRTLISLSVARESLWKATRHGFFAHTQQEHYTHTQWSLGLCADFPPFNNHITTKHKGTVLTALGDGSGGGEVSVLAVHVVGATAGIVTQPDAKVFHLQGRLLMNLQMKVRIRQLEYTAPKFLPQTIKIILHVCKKYKSQHTLVFLFIYVIGSACWLDHQMSDPESCRGFPYNPWPRQQPCRPCPYQAAVHGLSVRLLHLPQLGDEVPEAGLGHHMVGGEDPHAVQRRGRVLGRGQQTPDDFVLPKLEGENESFIMSLIQTNIHQLVQEHQEHV